MKVPGKNNMRKLTRFNAYGEEKRKYDFWYGTSELNKY